MSACKNCGEPVQQHLNEIPTHGNGIVYCGFVNAPIDWHDKHVAEFMDEAPRG